MVFAKKVKNILLSVVIVAAAGSFQVVQAAQAAGSLSSYYFSSDYGMLFGCISYAAEEALAHVISDGTLATVPVGIIKAFELSVASDEYKSIPAKVGVEDIEESGRQFKALSAEEQTREKEKAQNVRKRMIEALKKHFIHGADDDSRCGESDTETVIDDE